MIIVTGSSGGIGRGLVSQLARFDSVIGIYNSTAPTVEAVDGLIFEKINLLDVQQIRSFVEKYERVLNRLTVVHCAAKNIDKLAIHYETMDWDNVVDVNLKGDFLFSRALIPLMMRQQWGRLIHISSVVGQEGVPGTVAYAASKSALTGMSKVLSKEYGRFNITSNVLCLGYFEVGLIETLTEKARDKLLVQIPCRRFGAVSNIANTVRWLIESDYVNGAFISIDGGI